MATKFLLLSLLCALVFTNSNSLRLGMEKNGPLLENKFWPHLPIFGGGLGGKVVGLGGKVVGLGHRSNDVGLGGAGRFASGGSSSNGDNNDIRRTFGDGSGGGDSNGEGEVVNRGGDQEGNGKVFGGGAGGVP